MVAVEGGYITPKKGGISLSIEEFEEIVTNIPKVREEISKLQGKGLEQVLAGVNTSASFELLEKRYKELKGKFGESLSECSDSDVSVPGKVYASKKKRLKLDSSSESDSVEVLEEEEYEEDSVDDDDDDRPVKVSKFLDSEAKESRPKRKRSKSAVK
jgi:hypothetical protein